jgi:hypothetical protein
VRTVLGIELANLPELFNATNPNKSEAVAWCQNILFGVEIYCLLSLAKPATMAG